MYDKKEWTQTGIYAVVNHVNGRVYVGQTCKSFRSRCAGHYNLLRRNKHRNPLLQSDWNAYGPGAFDFYILEFVPRNEPVLLNAREWAYLRSFPNTYNIADPPRTGLF